MITIELTEEQQELLVELLVAERRSTPKPPNDNVVLRDVILSRVDRINSILSRIALASGDFRHIV